MPKNPDHWSLLLKLEVLVPFVLGSLLSWLVRWYYYHQFALDAQAQARIAETQLRTSRTLLEIFERQGVIELARDADGDITGGRIIHLAGNAVGKSTASGTLTVGPARGPK